MALIRYKLSAPLLSLSLEVFCLRKIPQLFALASSALADEWSEIRCRFGCFLFARASKENLLNER